MYELRHQQPLTPRQFASRLAHHGRIALVLVLVSLSIGIVGYHLLAAEHWVDAFLDAAMILGGMGQVNAIAATPGKLFAACYALYAGVVFIVVSGIMITPVLHRVMHRFHWESDRAAKESK